MKSNKKTLLPCCRCNYSFKFQNLIIALIKIMNEKDDIYTGALQEIEALTLMIDEELSKK